MVRVLRDPNKKGIGAPRGTATGVSARVTAGLGRVTQDTVSKGLGGVRRLIAHNPAKGTNANIGTQRDVVNGFRAGVQALLTTALAGANNDMVFTSRVVGALGNSTRVRIVVSGTSTPLSISVSGSDITINSATDGGGVATSTPNTIIPALAASAPAMALIMPVALAAGNDGTGAVVALGFTNLATGADSVLEGVDSTGDSNPTILKAPTRSTTPTHKNVVDRSPNRGLRKF